MTTSNSFLVGKYAETLWSGSGAIAMLTDTALKVAVVDLDVIGLAVTAATNASPSVITTATHGMAVGDRAYCQGALGNTAINGLFTINTAPSGTTFSFANMDGTVVAGNGTWTSGGRILKLDAIQFYSDISAGVIGTPVAMATSGRSTTGGLFKGPLTTLLSVPTGTTTELVALYKDTGTAGTSPVIGFMVGSLTTDGNNVAVSAPNGWLSLT